jgi:2-alkenal reductase
MRNRIMPIALLLFAIAAAGWVSFDYVQLATYSATTERAVTPRGNLMQCEETAIRIFKDISPSVAFVSTLEQLPELSSESAVERIGTGSGFVWDAAGHIVTNYHVVHGAQQIAVRFGSGSLHRAVVVGTAPYYDLAVLRIQGGHQLYKPLPLGSSANLQVGQYVYAIGNPFGLSRTLTHGLVSALKRRLPTRGGREVRGVIQTDAPINPGNSGGPLLDSSGRLIGVNTAILSRSGASDGVGFAVPVDLVNRVVTTLIKEGRMPTPGIGIAALSEKMAAHLDVTGVIVAAVEPGSPAAKAGLQGINTTTGQLGDVITQVDGKPVDTVADLAADLDEIGVGHPAKLTVERNGSTRKVDVTVEDISKH